MRRIEILCKILALLLRVQKFQNFHQISKNDKILKISKTLKFLPLVVCTRNCTSFPLWCVALTYWQNFGSAASAFKNFKIFTKFPKMTKFWKFQKLSNFCLWLSALETAPVFPFGASHWQYWQNFCSAAPRSKISKFSPNFQKWQNFRKFQKLSNFCLWLSALENCTSFPLWCVALKYWQNFGSAAPRSKISKFSPNFQKWQNFENFKNSQIFAFGCLHSKLHQFSPLVRRIEILAKFWAQLLRVQKFQNFHQISKNEKKFRKFHKLSNVCLWLSALETAPVFPFGASHWNISKILALLLRVQKFQNFHQISKNDENFENFINSQIFAFGCLHSKLHQFSPLVRRIEILAKFWLCCSAFKNFKIFTKFPKMTKFWKFHKLSNFCLWLSALETAPVFPFGASHWNISKILALLLRVQKFQNFHQISKNDKILKISKTLKFLPLVVCTRNCTSFPLWCVALTYWQNFGSAAPRSKISKFSPNFQKWQNFENFKNSQIFAFGCLHSKLHQFSPLVRRIENIGKNFGSAAPRSKISKFSPNFQKWQNFRKFHKLSNFCLWLSALENCTSFPPLVRRIEILAKFLLCCSAFKNFKIFTKFPKMTKFWKFQKLSNFCLWLSALETAPVFPFGASHWNIGKILGSAAPRSKISKFSPNFQKWKKISKISKTLKFLPLVVCTRNCTSFPLWCVALKYWQNFGSAAPRSKISKFSPNFQKWQNFENFKNSQIFAFGCLHSKLHQFSPLVRRIEILAKFWLCCSAFKNFKIFTKFPKMTKFWKFQKLSNFLPLVVCTRNCTSFPLWCVALTYWQNFCSAAPRSKISKFSPNFQKWQNFENFKNSQIFAFGCLHSKLHQFSPLVRRIEILAKFWLCCSAFKNFKIFTKFPKMTKFWKFHKLSNFCLWLSALETAPVFPFGASHWKY